MSVDRPTNAPLNGRAHGDRHSNGESFAKAGRQTPEYRTWLAMRQRCYTVTHMAYPRYGGHRRRERGGNPDLFVARRSGSGNAATGRDSPPSRSCA